MSCNFTINNIMEEFTELQLQYIKAFAAATGLTVYEIKDAVMSIKNQVTVAEKAALDLKQLSEEFLAKNTLSSKVEQRDRIPVPNHYKRNRFQR